LDWQQAIDSAVAVCFGTLAQRLPVSRAAIRSLLAGQKKKRLVVFDVNLRQKYFDRPLIEASLELARLVKLNDEEVRVLCQLLELPAKTEEEFCHYILDRFGVDAVCVTRGAQGCLMVDQSGMAEVPGIPVNVVDTVGAGDAFTAAWVTSRMMGWNLARQAELANRVGALVASLPGGMPSVKEEYQRLLKL
jgi:fructokinase